jgi:excisionase family DNA binding protein
MAAELYSVDQVAELLGLHVRTVRNYIRDGRLKAVRIGKQYRIAQADLEALTGQPVASSGVRQGARRAEVSSIVDLEGIDRALADRVMTLVISVSQAGRGSSGRLRLETVHDPERARLKIIIVGGVADTAELLKLIDALVEGES